MGIRAALRAVIGRGDIHYATDGRDILHNTPDGWEVDRPWLWFDGPAGGDGTGGPYGNPPPGATDGHGSTSLPAVMRCTSIICDTIAGMPWHVFKGYDQLPTPTWISDPQLSRADERVNGAALADNRFSGVEFWAQWLTSALWFGDGFIWVGARDAYGAPKAGSMYLLHPGDVTVENERYYLRGSDEPFGFDEIIHLRGQAPYDENKRGTGVLVRHADDLGVQMSLRSYSSGVYATGVPAGFLKVNDPDLTTDQAELLKAKWMRAHGNGRKSIAVLNATTDFQAITISPIDAQLTDAKSWSLRDIALIFGVPSYMLGVPGDPSTYANVEGRMTELRTFTLLPWQRRIESTLDAQFPAGTSLKIMTDGLARADTATRFQSYASALNAGWLTVNEVRALEDRPPLPHEVSTDSLDPTPLPTAELPTVPDDASELDTMTEAQS